MEAGKCTAQNGKSGDCADGLELAEGLGVHTFQTEVMNQTVFFQVIKLCDSFHLWVGTSSNFGDMSVAMNTKFSSLPTGSVLIGQSESTSLPMAQRLSKRTGKQVFVSSSLPFDRVILPIVEKRIGEELQAHPEFF